MEAVDLPFKVPMYQTTVTPAAGISPDDEVFLPNLDSQQYMPTAGSHALLLSPESVIHTERAG